MYSDAPSMHTRRGICFSTIVEVAHSLLLVISAVLCTTLTKPTYSFNTHFPHCFSSSLPSPMAFTLFYSLCAQKGPTLAITNEATNMHLWSFSKIFNLQLLHSFLRYVCDLPIITILILFDCCFNFPNFAYWQDVVYMVWSLVIL